MRDITRLFTPASVPAILRPMRKALLLIFAFSLFLSVSIHAHATEEYSRKTGLACRVCHVNPLGGGELTQAGKQYRAGLAASGVFRPPSLFKRVARLVTGYLHILAGVVWFGAIFYVHILLKPAYASKGLPKGELALGWTGIVVTGVTGALLTVARMPDTASFFNTRFGILLSIKILLYLLMASTAALVTFVLGPKMRKRREAAQKQPGDLTLEELRSFDGKEGRKSLVAVEGVIYEVTASRLWREGRHTRHVAGEDLTAALRQAPHGPDKLERFPQVGRVVAAAGRPLPDGPKALFYFVAYLNLVLVFLVLGVVALWRWW